MINEQELKEFYNKGVLAFEKQNYGYAIEIFSQILSLHYDNLEARHFLHLSLMQKAKNEPPSFTAKTMGAVSGLLLSMKAEGLLKKDNTAAALETLENMIASDPANISAFKKIAEVFYKKGLLSHAANNLEEAKTINPKDIDVLKKLGEIYLKKDDYQNARVNYESALKINPNDTDALRSLKNLDALGTIKREFNS
ncbi:MAG: tetratricopeptide repeat protein [Candidatus Omnitrophota bacterium]